MMGGRFGNGMGIPGSGREAERMEFKRFVFTTPKITPMWPSSADQGISHHVPGFSFLRPVPSSLILPQ